MKRTMCLAVAALFALSATAYAEDPVGPKLTPRLKDLIANEMQQVAQATAGLHAGRSRAFRFLTETLSHFVHHRSRSGANASASRVRAGAPMSGGPRSSVARPSRTESSCRESSSRFDPA